VPSCSVQRRNVELQTDNVFFSTQKCLHVCFSEVGQVSIGRSHVLQDYTPVATACSFGWWLMAGADLFWEKSTAGWLLMAGLFWEKSTAGWWLISKANRTCVGWFDRLRHCTLPSRGRQLRTVLSNSIQWLYACKVQKKYGKTYSSMFGKLFFLEIQRCIGEN
jgi:hypothetical protein